jgi:predicted RNase H-like HicB family nuclease
VPKAAKLGASVAQIIGLSDWHAVPIIGSRGQDIDDFLPKKGSVMRYKVVLQKSEEGYSVSCPGLPGCWSQGTTEAEALENIRDAIREYLAAVDDVLHGTPEAEVREVEVTV